MDHELHEALVRPLQALYDLLVGDDGEGEGKPLRLIIHKLQSIEEKIVSLDADLSDALATIHAGVDAG